MQARKIKCMECGYYSSCAQKTRIFVNYCGPENPTLQVFIRVAEEQCKSHCSTRLPRTSALVEGSFAG